MQTLRVDLTLFELLAAIAGQHSIFDNINNDQIFFLDRKSTRFAADNKARCVHHTFRRHAVRPLIHYPSEDRHIQRF
jgi:hypothetical protein